ncbi:helix-turn-helix domain-containing protein [Streptomyces sp. NPDC091371]|uniref:helix-turn-helix domain-containing protein n=1 Tax=Streptomyces sp. NPDC091371 TaxID=3155303 RepID=UPI003416F9FA
MFTSSWQRPLVLAAASLALVTGTACAAQASQSQAPTAVSSSPSHCVLGGAGGEGGKGGEGGRGGQPGQPGEPGKPGRVGCFRFEDLPDKSKSELNAVDKVRIVIVLMADDTDATKDKISKKYDISREQLDDWKKDYLAGDWCSLMAGGLPFCL